MPKLLTIVLLAATSMTVYAQDSLIVKSIYFGGGSYYIDGDQVLELKEFIESIEDLNHYEIAIFSHTDNIGSKEYNQWLSRMRSQAVFEELINIEVPRELIEIKDFGYTNPLYTNKSHAGRVKNRRVDVILSPIVY
ncbi:MAG: OmpA family protein [Fulvivirga sp.]|nr:OmpA family protein [Fulvivirga sp.]